MAKSKKKANARNIVIALIAVAVVVLAIVFLTTGNDSLGLFTPRQSASSEQTAQVEPSAKPADASAKEGVKLSGITVEMVDIGIGDSLIVGYPNGEVMVVDCGEAADAHFLIDALNEKGIQTIDYLVLTHPHTDHIGGASQVLDTYTVKTIIMPNAEHSTSTYEKLLNKIADGGYNVIEAYAGQKLDIGDAHLNFISPQKGKEYDGPNEYSAVFILSYGKIDMMFTGDMETPNEGDVMDAGLDRKVEILKVAHHGSKTSSGKKWLQVISPEVALVSAYGEVKNRPNADIMQRYADLGIQVYRTDLVGDIYVYISETGYEVVPMNNVHPRRDD